MPLNLQDFMSEVRHLGIQRANRFRVEMDPPRNLAIGGTGLSGLVGGFLGTGRTRQLSLRCQTANFPGVQLMTKDDVLRYGHGPVDKTVHNALFGDITCVFVVDGKGLIQDFFYKWQKAIVNFDSSDSMTSQTNGATPYEVTYKDDYTTLLTIDQLNEKNQRVVTCIAQKAFPVSVGDMFFSWEANDQVQLLPVTFSYRDHKLINY
jgi:hypothetical protein